MVPAYADEPSLPFSRDEHAARQSRLRRMLSDEGFDAVLVFAQESHYWLTGYDSGGFVFFQCAVVTANGAPIVLLTRRPDLLQARQTSTIDDIRLWWDAEDANPAIALRELLRELGLAGKRVAIELGTHGLTGLNLWRIQQAMDGFCTLVDDEYQVRLLRLCKSPAEIAYQRQAGRLLDRSLARVVETAAPGRLDASLTAACLGTILEGGGDMPPNPPLFNSGPRAVYGRGVSAPRQLEACDQLLVEYPVSYRRYCVKTEWTLVFGRASERQRDMYRIAREALAKMTEMARPGTTLGKIFDVYADTLDRAGYGRHRFGATGYSVGISYAPTSMDVPPMIYAGSPTVCQPGMTLFYHVMNGDSDTGLAMGVGHTLLVTEGTPELLTSLPEALTEIT